MTQLNMNNFIAVNEGNSEILGKFVYFSLSNILIEKSELVNIIEALNLSLSLSSRATAADSFKSATGIFMEDLQTNPQAIWRFSEYIAGITNVMI